MRSHLKPIPWDSDIHGLQLILTESVIQTIEACIPLRKNLQQHENVLYVAGLILPEARVGLTVIAPRCTTGPGFYHTDADAHADVMLSLRTLRLKLVAQVHCHPGKGVSHSDVDDTKAIVRAEGHWSIVVPYYGNNGVLPLTICGIHCYKRGKFYRLRQPAVAARVQVVPDWVDLRGGMN